MLPCICPWRVDCEIMGIMLGCADRAAILLEAPDQLGDECCFAAVLIADDLEYVWPGLPGFCQQNQTPFAASLSVDCSIKAAVETLSGDWQPVGR